MEIETEFRFSIFVDFNSKFIDFRSDFFSFDFLFFENFRMEVDILKFWKFWFIIQINFRIFLLFLIKL